MPALADAHAAWKAACQEARDIRQRLPISYMTDENRSTWLEDRARIEAQHFAADRAARAAFKVMAHALPEAGKSIFISPRDWLAKKDAWRTEFAAVKVWNNAPFYMDWYPCIAMYEVDTSTGERFLRMVEMFDECVDEAERRNAAYADYYAKKAAA